MRFFPQVFKVTPGSCGRSVSGSVVSRQPPVGQREQRQHTEGVGREDGQTERGSAWACRRGMRIILSLCGLLLLSFFFRKCPLQVMT